MVQTFGDSVWWASMNVTTVGSNIFAVTSMGKIMSVLLAALGMMTFPIFTVYITSKVGEINDKKKKYFGIINKKDRIDRIGREEKNSKNTNSPDNSDTNSSSDTSANK